MEVKYPCYKAFKKQEEMNQPKKLYPIKCNQCKEIVFYVNTIEEANKLKDLAGMYCKNRPHRR